MNTMTSTNKFTITSAVALLVLIVTLLILSNSVQSHSAYAGGGSGFQEGYTIDEVNTCSAGGVVTGINLDGSNAPLTNIQLLCTNLAP